MNKTDKRRILFAILFFLYLAVLVYLLFFSDAYGRTEQQADYRYNFVPFREIGRYLRYVHDPVAKFLNLGGNILAFVPFGVLLPLLYPDLRKWWVILLNTLSLSVSVEVVQLITMVGTFDVDDLILNTAGGMLGYLILFLATRRKSS